MRWSFNLNLMSGCVQHRFAGLFSAFLLAVTTSGLITAPLSATPRKLQAAQGHPSSAKAWHRSLSKDQKARLLLNRITFGLRPGDVTYVESIGLKAFLDQQLHPERLDDSTLESRLAELPTLWLSSRKLALDFTPPKPNAGKPQKPAQLMAAANAGYPMRRTRAADDVPFQAGSMMATEEIRQDGDEFDMQPPSGILDPQIEAAQGPRRVLMELGQEELLRAVYSRRQLQEVMVQFWMNHFNIFAGKGPDRFYLTAFEQETIRPHALGHFEDLLVASAESPAMLFYLDNWLSASPDSEAGKGQTGGAMAAQQFMRAPGFASRPASARNLPPARPRARLARGLNENYGRELMELHTLGVKGGYTQQDVIEVARCFTGWTLRQPAKGGGFFFNSRMHDYGSKEVLGHVIPAGRGMQDGLDVLHILAANAATARFISTELARRFVSDNPPPTLIDRATHTFLRTRGDIRAVLETILTSPEFYSAAAQDAKVKSPLEYAASALRALSTQTDGGAPLLFFIGKMGEPLFQYQPPSGYADRASTWINSGELLERMNFALALGAGRLRGTGYDLSRIDSGYAAEPPEELLNALSLRIAGRKLSPSTQRAIMDRLDSAAAENNPLNRAKPRAQLVVSLILASPEFQRR